MAERSRQMEEDFAMRNAEWDRREASPRPPVAAVLDEEGAFDADDDMGMQGEVLGIAELLRAQEQAEFEQAARDEAAAAELDELLG